MFLGSNVFLTERINSIVSVPTWFTNESRFPKPIPCSPVQVPPNSITRVVNFVDAAFAAR